MTEVTELVELSADAAGLSRQDRLAQLRRQIASIPSRGDTSFSGPSVSVAGVSGTSAAAFESVADRDIPVVNRAHKAGVLPVPEGIGALLPQGGLVRGTVVSVEGAASLLLGLVASVTASGGMWQSSGNLDWDCWRRTRWVRNWNVWRSFRRLGRIRSRSLLCCLTVWIW
ncbi:hypothetical protein G9444_2115 [Rhodococcus erythropolis]|uniref:Uncharacterized protein n=1 Tax=Rhodococcus erythropolis TaxID=1833 RepID=A0A6G9CR60_RHOER|nr:hypothetical protein G9444_2115 [Rhodococcus erythropolis]